MSKFDNPCLQKMVISSNFIGGTQYLTEKASQVFINRLYFNFDLSLKMSPPNLIPTFYKLVVSYFIWKRMLLYQYSNFIRWYWLKTIWSKILSTLNLFSALREGDLDFLVQFEIQNSDCTMGHILTKNSQYFRRISYYSSMPLIFFTVNRNLIERLSNRSLQICFASFAAEYCIFFILPWHTFRKVKKIRNFVALAGVEAELRNRPASV